MARGSYELRNYGLLILLTISWNSPERWLEGQAVPLAVAAARSMAKSHRGPRTDRYKWGEL